MRNVGIKTEKPENWNTEPYMIGKNRVDLKINKLTLNWTRPIQT